MYKKGAGNDKQGKDAGNRTLCPYRNFNQAIKGKTKLGSIPYYDLDIFSTTNKANALSVVVLHNVNGFLVFSHFKKQNSTCLQQDQNST